MRIPIPSISFQLGNYCVSFSPIGKNLKIFCEGTDVTLKVLGNDRLDRYTDVQLVNVLTLVNVLAKEKDEDNYGRQG